jgi:predicted DNA-binding antitoxin AbrB/MazE fold protein
MVAIRAVYDGKVFIPKIPCEIEQGSEVTLTIEDANTNFLEQQKTLASFKQLTKEVKELNETNPLPSSFDEILSQRLQFRELSAS